MWGWLWTYGVAFVLVFSTLLLAVEMASRWSHRSGASDRYLSRRWVRELNGK